MNEVDFNDLVTSVKQAEQIMRGEIAPSRYFVVVPRLQLDERMKVTGRPRYIVDIDTLNSPKDTAQGAS